MIITLLSALLSFGGSFLPKIIEYFQDRQDKAHELDMMKLQIEAQKAGYQEKLDEVSLQADIAEIQAVHQPQSLTNIWIIDFLNGIVRPFVALGFFFLYVAVKVASFLTIYHAGPGTDVATTLLLIWHDEDWAIFGAILGFYFGARHMLKPGTK